VPFGHLAGAPTWFAGACWGRSGGTTQMATMLAPSRGSVVIPAPSWLVSLALAVVGSVIAATLYFRIVDQSSAAPIAPQSEPASRGVASLSIGTGDSSLALALAGVEPGKTYVARLYAGTPEEPSASSGVLGSCVAAADGTAIFEATSVRLGGSGAQVELSPELLADGPRFVNVHQEPTRVVVATASLPYSIAR
jgi:hypothetical protein